ncbi:hypothetical protein EDD16DRAFT_1675390 [Pisolithus croceorrhizus]|nr:hypothetical protein EDD16DRAFT_1675390 [Pisolithus croceorrhizus]
MIVEFSFPPVKPCIIDPGSDVRTSTRFVLFIIFLLLGIHLSLHIDKRVDYVTRAPTLRVPIVYLVTFSTMPWLFFFFLFVFFLVFFVFLI